MNLHLGSPTCHALAVVVTVALVAAPAAATKRRAFVTSTTGTGDLSSWAGANGLTGVAAGDAICQARAAAASLPNSSAYRAWLSTGANDAYCHLKGLAGKKGSCTGGAGTPAGPWYLVNGVSNFSGDVDSLVGSNPEIYRAVTYDEFGTPIPEGERYWTGTIVGGYSVIFGNYTCNGWKSGSSGDDGLGGRADATARSWTDLGWRNCSVPQHLLCLESGASDFAPPRWLSDASIVFVTSVAGTADLHSWPEAGDATGLEAGDAICRQLASDAHLPEPDSFVAWLSNDSTNAYDRMTSTGPFRRVDGHLLAINRTDLFDGSLLASVHVDEKGHYLAESSDVWTGTYSNGASISNCLGFTTASHAESGSAGRCSLSLTDDWSWAANYFCDATWRLYCFSNSKVLMWDGFEYSSDLRRWDVVQP